MKTKNILAACALSLTALTTLSACACGSSNRTVYGDDDDRPEYLQDSKRWGKVVTEQLSGVTDITAIKHADANADVYYEQGPTVSVEIEANEKVRADHRIYVKGSTLILESAKKGRPFSGNRPTILVRVTSPTLHSISTSGTGDVKVKNAVNFDNALSLSASGTGDIEMHTLVCSGDLQARASGTGDVEIESATCPSADLSASGTGDIDISRLICEGDVVAVTSGTGDIDLDVRCRNLTATTSGTGDMDLDVDCDLVRADASGTGDMELSGRAKRLEKERSGLSHIRSKELKVSNVEY